MSTNDGENEESLSTLSERKDELKSPIVKSPHPFENMDIVTRTAATSSSPMSNPQTSKQMGSRGGPSSSKKKSRKKRVLDMYKRQSSSTEKASRRIVTRLKDMYKGKVLPAEKRYHLHSFCLPTNGEIRDAEFEARPMVLLLGQYSTGKTSFIRHLLGGLDFPGMHIGPEPTTDKFIALVHGNEDGVSNDDEKSLEVPASEPKDLITHGKILKGNTLTVTPELPFASLSQFGSAFLQHFEGSVSPAPLLHNINLIDTPGVLSGEKQRLNREYDFAQVARWFADRSDLILLLFDAHKLDISDELKEVVATIKPNNDDKIRCVLNKADSIKREELVRVYGSLMWSMGKLFHNPEVVRVYTGSYWDEPLVNDDFENMFESDEWNLLNELINLRSVCVERKVNTLVKRIRLVKVHMCLLGYIGQQMPRWYGKEAARRNVLRNLSHVFAIVANKYDLPQGDIPNVDEFRKCLEHFDDFSIFPALDRAALQQLDNLVNADIPSVMRGLGGVTDVLESSQTSLTPSSSVPTKTRSISDDGFSTVTKLEKSKRRAIIDNMFSVYSIIGFLVMVVLGLGITFLLIEGASERATIADPH